LKKKKDSTGQVRTAKRSKSHNGYISPIWQEASTEAIYIKNYLVGDLLDVITCAKFKMKLSMVTILERVEFFISLLMFEWALQQCRATALFGDNCRGGS